MANNNTIIISKKALIPAGLVIAIVAIAISGAMFVSDMQSSIASTVVELNRHAGDVSVHQPYRDKLASWYTRAEGEALEMKFLSLDERLDSIERKLDILIAAQSYNDNSNKQFPSSP